MKKKEIIEETTEATEEEVLEETATPAPDIVTESSPSTEDSGAQVAAVRPTPESHPHLFDEFSNLK